MKKHPLYYLLITLLLIILQPVSVHAQDHYTDSLRRVIQTASRESDRLHATVLLARGLLPDGLDSASVLLESAAALEHSEKPFHRADYYNAWGLYYWDLRNREASAENYKKTLHLQPHPSIVSNRAEAANHVGLLYFQRGIADSARTYLHKAYEIDRERGNKEGMAKTMYDLSRLHRMHNQYELAFIYVTEAIKLKEAFEDSRLLPFLYTLLGNTHAALDENDEAATAYRQSLALALESGMDHLLPVYYNNMAALWCQHDGGLDTTLYYAETGLQLAHASGRTDLIASLLTNKAQAYLTSGDAARALEFFKESLEYIYQLNNLRMEMDVSHRSGKAYKALGALHEARQAQQRSREIAEELQSPGFQSKALLELAAIDSLKNNFKDFAKHYVQGIRLRDSIWSQENRSRIAELQIIHATEQKEREIEQLKQRESIRKLRTTIILAGSGLVFLLLILIILYLGNRQKLIRQKYLLQQQKAEAKLEANLRELTGKALSLARSDQLIAQLKKDIQVVIEKKEGENRDDLRSALQLLKSKDNSQQLWQEFETRFNELNEGFIRRLTTQYPTLSPAEIRLCAMLRMQLTTKEIADLIKRSTRTIENTRNNTRKKMGLQSGDNLVQLLLQI